MKQSAVISDCQQYRYELRRVWDDSKPFVLFIGLNPSTAGAEAEDNTSRVCINYAKRCGYGGLLLGNLFTFRSIDQSALYTAANPVGSKNGIWVKKLQAEAKMVICVWGATGGYQNRDKVVLGFLQGPLCLTKLKSGYPGHPLYKSVDLQPVPYEC